MSALQQNAAPTARRRQHSVRHEAAAADSDAGGGVGPIGILGGGRDGDVGANLELALVADHVVDDRGIRIR